MKSYVMISVCVTLFFILINALVYINILQGIYRGKILYSMKWKTKNPELLVIQKFWMFLQGNFIKDDNPLIFDVWSIIMLFSIFGSLLKNGTGWNVQYCMYIWNIFRKFIRHMPADIWCPRERLIFLLVGMLNIKKAFFKAPGLWHRSRV